MIVDKLQDLSKYASVHPRFGEAFEFLRELLEQNAADGKYVKPDTDVPRAIYVSISTDTPKNKEAAVAESHEKYIDVQVILEGEENMYIPAVSTPGVSVAYNPEKDIMYHDALPFASCHALRMTAGNFVIFFAGELHAPSCAVKNGSSTVRKVVLKVLA